MFLNFVNFYRRFIAHFFKLFASLSNMLKKMQNEMKKKLFLLTFEKEKTFNLLREIFQYVLILIHFDSDFFIKLKIDASNFEIADIISQLQSDDQ